MNDYKIHTTAHIKHGGIAYLIENSIHEAEPELEPEMENVFLCTKQYKKDKVMSLLKKESEEWNFLNKISADFIII